MLFLVTSHFRNSNPDLNDRIKRVGAVTSHNDQYDAGDLISIGRNANGSELTCDAIQKQKGSPDVVLIGHLNQAGRLLDPDKQPLECAAALTEASYEAGKEIKSLLTARSFLDKEIEKDEVAAIEKRIKAAQEKKATLQKKAAEYAAKKPV